MQPGLKIAKSDPTDIIERALPPLLLMKAIEELNKKGYEIRADVQARLAIAVAAPFAKIDEFMIERLIKRADVITNNLLAKLPDDPVDRVYSVCMFNLKLVDEGLLDDKQNMAVLVSLLLLDDVEDDRKDAEGREALKVADHTRWKTYASAALSSANLHGLYLRQVVCN